MSEWSKYLLVAALVATFLDDKALYVLFYSLCGIVFVAEYLTRAVAKRLRISVHISRNRLNWGGEVNMAIKVENPSPIPIPWSVIRLSLPASLLKDGVSIHVMPIPARGSATAEFSLVGGRRGAYNLSGFTASIGDGVTDLARKIDQRDEPIVELLVYPRIWILNAFRLPSRHPYGHTKSQLRFFEDPSRVMGVRDYQPGDNPKRVNWKATARVGELQVKEFQPTITLDTLLLLDLEPKDYPESNAADLIEMAIETAASLCYMILMNSQTLGFVTNVGKGSAGPAEIVVRQGKGVGQLSKIMDLLARIEPSEGVDFSRTVHAGRLGAQPGSTVIVVVPGRRGDIFDSCLILKKAGYKVTLVVIGGVENPSMLGSLLTQGVSVHQIHSALELERLVG